MRLDSYRIEVIMSQASEHAIVASQSFAILRRRLTPASIRSTNHRLAAGKILLRHQDV